jgi:2-polyprenyl-3-methyl-5-hydroxy-6-metoxy-1,4-benzoquinol methylase
MLTQRAQNEIAHGKKLLQMQAEITWGWGSPAGQVRARRRGDLIARAAGLGPGTRVLEVGCGTGVFTELFARTGAHVLAVDISPDLLEKAKERRLPPSQVRFLAQPFEECDAHGPFDAVVGSSVLHHIEVERSLRKIYDLLRPGGTMAFGEPNMLNPQVFVMKNVPFVKRLLGDSPDETAFVRWRLRSLLRAIGFMDVRITPVDWLHPATPRWLIGPVAVLGRVLEHLPLLREFSGSLLISARRPALGAARARAA